MAKKEQGWQTSEDVNSEMSYAVDDKANMAQEEIRAEDRDESDVDESSEIDPQLVEMALKKLAAEQNLSMAFVAASVSAYLVPGPGHC